MGLSSEPPEYSPASVSSQQTAWNRGLGPARTDPAPIQGRQAPLGVSEALITPQAPARHKHSLHVQEKHAAGTGSLSQS